MYFVGIVEGGHFGIRRLVEGSTRKLFHKRATYTVCLLVLGLAL